MSDSLAVEQLKADAPLRAQMDMVFKTWWQTISQYFLPNESDINTTKTEGVAGWTDEIYDTTGIQSVQVLAAGQFNWWTPPNQGWAEYAPPGAEQNKEGEEKPDDEAVQWLEKAGDRMMRELGRSNFYSVKGQADASFAAFNTDVMIFDESETGTELFNFTHCKIGTYTIEEDYKGVVDTLRRDIKMTYRQICQKFGGKDDKIPEKMAEQSKKDPTRQWVIKHCIFPREDSERLPGRKDAKNKPWASVYIAVDFKECIRVSGYDENPILCRRFAKWGTDAVWGYGPSYLALPDARQVNYVQQYLDALAELHAYPRVLTPDNLVGDVDLRAGGNTTWDTSNPLGKPEEWATAGEYKLGLEMQEKRRQCIRDAFFVDAFKLLNSQPLLDKEMTAYEISQRQAEQLQGVTPAFTRSIPEFINPLMKRGFGIMFRRGVLGQPPEALLQPIGPGKAALVQPEIVVTSRFNDALRALKNRGIEETMQFILPVAPLKPEIMDVVDFDETLRTYARNSGGVSLRGDKLVKQIRAARAEAMAQERAAAMAQHVSAATANLAKSPGFVQDAAQQAMPGQRGRSAA
jgi:hypothetical protein